MNSKQLISQLASQFGIDIKKFKVKDERVYDEIISKRNLGLGESYMKGWWQHEALDDFICDIVRNKPKMEMTWRDILNFSYVYIRSYITNFQSPSRSLEVGINHYDLGDEIYTNMLGKSMTYTCAYWKDNLDKNQGSYSLTGVKKGSKSISSFQLELDKAQEAKLDLICRKLKLHERSSASEETGGLTRVLDIGCGYGSFAKYASEKYGVTVTGITISNGQLAYARRNMSSTSPKRVSSDMIDYEFMDYRDLLDSKYKHRYDAVVSIGMIEHVGWQNYDTFMKVVCHVMKKDGLALVHSIVGLRSKLVGNVWVTKYIFPGGLIPSLPQLSNSIP